MVIRRHRFLQHLDRLPNQRVVVIGPAVAEVDVRCDVPRLAPDRCMPVYRVDDMSVHPGAAALVASTISGLGGRATLIAPVGRGRPGMALRRVLDEHRVTLIEGGDEGVRTPELYRYVTATSGRQLLQMRRGWQKARFVNIRSALDRAAADADPAISAVCLVDGLPAALTNEDVAAATAWASERGIPFIFDAAGAGLVPMSITAAPAEHSQGDAKKVASSDGPATQDTRARHVVLNNSESLLFARRLLSGASSDGGHDEPVARARGLRAALDSVVVLTLGREGAIVAAPPVDIDPDSTPDADADGVTTNGNTSSTVTGHNEASLRSAEPPGDSGLVRLPTNPLPMSDRRGVGFVFSGVYALLTAAGATPAEAAFMASGSATAAAAQPGPKRASMDGLVKIAYREIETQVADGIEVFDSIARDHLPIIDRAARLLLDAYSEGRQVLVFGNGGSAAEANHLAGELTGRFRQSRPGLPAISLSANDSIATCIANDYGYEHVFARQIDTFCRKGDVVIGLTTSGRSANVVSAMERARAIGARTVALVGADPGPLGELADVVVAVPSRSTGRIQEAHLFIIHVMCDMLDRRLDAVGRLQPAASEI